MSTIQIVEREISMNVSIVEDVVLEPCPLCGAIANLKTDTGPLSTLFWAKCSNRDCHICGPSSSHQEAAVEKWNTRL